MTLFDLTQMMKVADLKVVDMETSLRIDTWCFLKKEFIKLIYIVPSWTFNKMEMIQN